MDWIECVILMGERALDQSWNYVSKKEVNVWCKDNVLAHSIENQKNADILLFVDHCERLHRTTDSRQRIKTQRPSYFISCTINLVNQREDNSDDKSNFFD